MKYGKAIRTLRSVRGLSQKALASRVNLGPSHLSLLESDTRTPSTGTIESLSKALDVPVYLFMLLASEDQDLRGISSYQASFLGKQMIDVLTQANIGAGDETPPRADEESGIS